MRITCGVHRSNLFGYCTDAVQVDKALCGAPGSGHGMSPLALQAVVSYLSDCLGHRHARAIWARGLSWGV